MDFALLKGDRSEPTLGKCGEKTVVKLPYRDCIACVIGTSDDVQSVELRHGDQCIGTHVGAGLRRLEIFFAPNSQGEITLLLNGERVHTIAYVRMSSD